MSDPQIVVNIVKFGERETVTLPEGATKADVLAKLGEQNLDIKVGGRPLADVADQPAKDGETFTATPKSIKQG